MKRSNVARLVLTAVAAAALVGCGPSRDHLTGAWDQYGYNGNQSAYRAMASGDPVGQSMVEDKIYFAKKNNDNSVYATVLPLDGE